MPRNRYQGVLRASPAPFAATAGCASCEACCCRLEVLLISDTGVPDRYVDMDEWGGRVMARLEDGWCAALDRNTMMCTIYEMRPLICREFEVGEHECRAERAACLGRADRVPDV